MPILSTRPVTSTTATITMSKIPTGACFRSPDLTYPDAYYVDRGGDTYSRYYVTGSYGYYRRYGNTYIDKLVKFSVY